MKGDFTRWTFRSENHYRGVLLQQGRVALDADWNEQVDIQQHHDEATTRDVIGAGGGPKIGAGFAITDADGGVPRACPPEDLRLSAGRYYLGGVLCENERPVRLSEQPDLPGVPLPGSDGRYAAYLDVWREHLTAVERPELREVALGGPDTATRSRTIWQVRLKAVPNSSTPEEVTASWPADGERSTGRLRARAQAPAPSTTPCVIPPSAGYRRLENQLYRVEIRSEDTGPAYVWSRDNGTVVARLVSVDGGTLVIDSPGRDHATGFAQGDLVEVGDLAGSRRGECGSLGRLTAVNGVTLTVAWAAGTPPAGLTDPMVVRRWDCAEAAPVTDGWLNLEDGVQVQFETAAARYRNGDYWLIPARTALSDADLADADLAGDVEWPIEEGNPAFRPPGGIEHRSAPIALLDQADGMWNLVADCRALFTPLADVPDAPVTAPGLHVEDVLLRTAGTPLRNDTTVGLEDFLGGIAVRLDGTPSATLTGKPVFSVTLDLPHPLFASDRRNWGLPEKSTVVLGTRPLELAGTVSVNDRELIWQLPAEEVRVGVASVLKTANGLVHRVRCRLIVNGRAIVDAEDPRRVLNGLALSRLRDDEGIDVVLPTVDDVRGADFTMWFWIAVSDLTGKFDVSLFDKHVFA